MESRILVHVGIPTIRYNHHTRDGVSLHYDGEEISFYSISIWLSSSSYRILWIHSFPSMRWAVVVFHNCSFSFIENELIKYISCRNWYIITCLYTMNYKKLLLIWWVFLFWLWLYLPSFFGNFITGRIENSPWVIEKPDYRFFRSNDPDLKYTYILNVPIEKTTTRSFQVFPNDCIESLTINGVPYEGLEWDLCNAWVGIRLKDLHKYLKLGDNEFIFKVNQIGSSRSFFLKPSIDDPIRMMSFILLGLWFLFILWNSFSDYFIFNSQKKKIILFSLLSASFLLWLTYMIHEDFFRYTHDLTGHLDYLKLLLRWSWIPLSWDCWQCYHPNLYYRTWKFVYVFASKLWWAEPFEWVRWFTFLLWNVWLIFALKFIYLLRKRENPNSYLNFILLSSLFLLRTTFFYMWWKIHNETMLDWFIFMALFFWLKSWYAYKDSNPYLISRNLLISVFILSLWARVKSNSLMRIPVVFMWITSDILRTISPREIIFKIRSYRITFVKLVVILWIIFIPLVYITRYKWIHDIVDNADRLAWWIPYSGTWLSKYEVFLRMDIPKFLTQPDIWVDSDHFFSFISKTMIIWETNFTQKNLYIYTYLLAIWLFLLLLSFITIAVLMIGSNYSFFALWLFLPYIVMILMRMRYDLAPIMHFRYILPSVLFMHIGIFFLLNILEKWKGIYRRLLLYFLYAIISAFVILSVYYSIPPYF